MKEALSVRMFGGFSAAYGGEVLAFGGQKDPKFKQLFQILMTRPGREFSKREVVESLYDCEAVEDANASLNNTIFRLRKYLRKSPLPPGEYLVLKDGMLRFDGGIVVESDAWALECAGRELAEERDREKRAELCGKICELYRGELLPRLSNELWVIEKSKEYKEIYFNALDILFSYLKEEDDYKNMECLAAHACEIYPCEGWESWRIESLLVLGCREEAERVYRETAERAQEIGGFLSREQQERFHKVGARICYPEGTAEEIGKCLMEPEAEEGAYGCTLPGFSDCFRMLKRVTARRGPICFSLLLCTILDAGGRPVQDRKACEKQGERLCMSFKKYLRRGDIYAKYSENQYLLLCTGAERGNFSDIGLRLDMDFRKRCGGRGGISCRLLDEGRAW